VTEVLEPKSKTKKTRAQKRRERFKAAYDQEMARLDGEDADVPQEFVPGWKSLARGTRALVSGAATATKSLKEKRVQNQNQTKEEQVEERKGLAAVVAGVMAVSTVRMSGNQSRMSSRRPAVVRAGSVSPSRQAAVIRAQEALARQRHLKNDSRAAA
ncbi:MAG: hypothetical protein WA843_04370, partial [Candidatus Saccharimonadales bacterium]